MEEKHRISGKKSPDTERLALKKLRGIFLGSVVLSVLIVAHLMLMYFGAVRGHWIPRAMLFPMLLWSLTVTSYSFHALWVIDQGRRHRLEELANKDVASDTYNAAYFYTSVQEQETSLGMGGGIGYIQVNGLKEVNGEYGYAAGDVAIKMLADLMKKHLPWNGLIARLGGVEFGVFLPGTTVEAARETMEKIQADIAEFSLDLAGRGTVSGLSATIGVVPFESGEDTTTDVILAARKAAQLGETAG